jgi:hypothetical protein
MDRASREGDSLMPALLPICRQMLKPPQGRPSALQVHEKLTMALSEVSIKMMKEIPVLIPVGEVSQGTHIRKKSRFFRKLGSLSFMSRMFTRKGQNQRLRLHEERQHVSLKWEP